MDEEDPKYDYELVRFVFDLTKDDPPRMLARAQAHIEQSLRQFILANAAAPLHVERQELDFDGTLRLALILGLNPDVKRPLKALGVLQSRFARSIDADFNSQDADNFYNTLNPLMKEILRDVYPHSIPEVRETADRIPPIQDRHVNPANKTLCLGVPEHLWLACQGDFSFERLIEGPIRNFLIGNSLVEEGQNWPFGETSHGGEGILQFYADLMGISDGTKLTSFLLALSKGRVPGHSPCPCGSGKVIRTCHAEGWRSLWNVPKSLIAHSAKQAITLERTP